MIGTFSDLVSLFIQTYLQRYMYGRNDTDHLQIQDTYCLCFFFYVDKLMLLFVRNGRLTLVHKKQFFLIKEVTIWTEKWII